MDSEILKSFNETREEFMPYGFTLERWTPCLMPRQDRHNEVEINYLSEGSLTYLFHGKRETVPAGRLTLFWGLVPHRIVDFEGNVPYYVGTIPFSLFLSWNLPDSFVARVLKGEMLRESDGAFAVLDEFVWRVWLEDARQGKNQEMALSELKARLWRMATRWSVSEQKVAMRGGEASVVERMAIYIAQNYARPLKIADIGKAVGLHPDYANHLFKKSFKCTLSDYVMEERIARAQRDLLSSQMGITEIAFNCGFNSISRFNAAFLKICGCTPREFRKHGGR